MDDQFTPVQPTPFFTPLDTNATPQDSISCTPGHGGLTLVEHVRGAMPHAGNGGGSANGFSTPVNVVSRYSAPRPVVAPQTPAKQRRTCHTLRSEFSELRVSTRPRKAVTAKVAPRKRMSEESQQPSIWNAEEPTLSPPQHQSRTLSFTPVLAGSGNGNGCVAGGGGPLVGVTGSATTLTSYSVPSSPHFDTLRLGGVSFSMISSSQPLQINTDMCDVSQADTECSNILTRRIITDFREIADLGAGSFGKVILCEETSTGQLFAIKVSAPLQSPDQLHRFRRERGILQAIRGFPHVIQLHSAWEEGRIPQMYLQLELCRGSVESVARQRREAGEAWLEEEVLDFAGQMAIALDALHSVDIAHVDFKPDNVLIDEVGTLKLADFGCSVVLDEAGRPRTHLFQSTSGHHAGSAARAANPFYLSLNECTQTSLVSVEEGDCRYLCSDMMNQKRFFKAGDMFSFGMSLFELMSGKKLPQNGNAFLELRRKPPADVLVAQGYSKGLVQLVTALMQSEPTARPSARDVLQFLKTPPEAIQMSNLPAHSLNAAVADGTLGPAKLRYFRTMLEVNSRLLEVMQRDLLHLPPPNPFPSRRGGASQPQGISAPISGAASQRGSALAAPLAVQRNSADLCRTPT